MMMLGSRPAGRPLPRSRMQVFLAASHVTTTPDVLQTPVHKPLCDKRNYQHAQLQNGARALLVQDKDAVYAAVCASIQVGYFDDPPTLPGAAHFLEHMVHLGSERFPDEKEYKGFLAQHGGSSNASTSMVHTKYHFKVHHSALQGALQRFGAMLSCPLIAPDSAAREVENVHAEYSRNTNSDGRKLLQLRRSLCEAPYSNFSTGSFDTLWQQPTASGIDVPAVLKDMWKQCYRAQATCVAVVGPQEPDVLLKWVEASVEDMPSRSTANGVIDGSSTDSNGTGTTSSAADVSSYDSSSTSISIRKDPASVAALATAPALVRAGAANADGWPAAVLRYPVNVVGCRGPSLVCVSPQRDLRELEVSWYIPEGMMKHSSTKPWSWASHLLGYEGVGSVAHLLKAQGLVQNLSVGTGEEVRLARGWMFWRVQASLTRAGEDALGHVLATIYRGVQLMQQCSDAELASTWQEAARLAELRFNWQDPTEPLACAQSAAYALHYYTPEATLSGCHLMTEFDPAVLRGFVEQLTPDNMTVFYSSHRNKSIVDSKEQWYGADYSVQSLPHAWLDSIAEYRAIASTAQQSTAALTHGTLSGNDPGGVCAGGLEQSRLHSTAQQPQQQQGAQLEPLPGQIRLPEPNWALPQDLSLRHNSDLSLTADSSASASPTPAVYDGAPAPPQLLRESPGLCAWVKTDVSYGLPKVHLHLHLVTPLTYSSPTASVATRLLLRVVEDLLLPVAYPAELAGSHYDLSSEQGGLTLKVVGFPGVAQKLLLMVLQGLTGITRQQVQDRFATMSGRLVQNLTNWAKNNPQQHAEYAAHHLLQLHHHHNTELLQAAAAAAPDQLMGLQEQLAAGSDLHIDMLAYGNISRQEAADLVVQLQQQLKPQGLPAGVWPPAGRVLCLCPVSNTRTPLQTAHQHGGQGDDSQQVQLATYPIVTDVNSAVAASCSLDFLTASSCNSNILVTYLPEDPNPSNSNSAIYYTIQLGPDSVQTAVLLDLFVQMSSKAAFHELRTRRRLGYSVSLNTTSLHRQLGLVIRVQSPTTTPGALVSAVRGWLAGYRSELQDAAQKQLDNAKKALRDKYLDPPKSLREAARRTWVPISTRSLAFDRRQQKATQADALDQQQLINFYDTYVDPGGPMHQALCVHISGGSQQTPPEVSTAQAEGQATSRLPSNGSSSIPGPGSDSDHIIIKPEDVDVFKRRQPLMALPDFIPPPPAE